MIIKKYLVDSIDEVQEIMKREMGPHAMILTTRHIKYTGQQSSSFSNKVEVVAAVDEKDLKNFQEDQKIHLTDQKMIETVESFLKNSGHDVGTSISTYHSPYQDLLRVKEEVLQKFYQISPQESAPLRSTKFEQHINNQYQTLRDEIIHQQFSLPQEDKDSSLRKELMKKGISREIASIIEARLIAQHAENDPNAIKREISSILVTSGPICLSEDNSTLVAIVGLSGIGKTTTLVKLALEYTGLLNRQVAIISIDKNGLGTLEQLKVIENRYGIPCTCVENKEQLQEAIISYQEFDLVLIDTFGCSFHHLQALEELDKLLREIDNLQVLLAINSSTKEADIFEIIKQFSRFLPESLVFTKIDETLTLGITVNVCYYTKMAISYLTFGDQLNQSNQQDLLIADPDELAQYIYTSSNVPYSEP